MAKQPFRAEVQPNPEPGKPEMGPSKVVQIDLHGEINAFSDSALNAAYRQADQLDPANIVLNFSDVDYINSTGIALIVGLLAQARKARRRLSVFGLSDHYIEIFRITRLSDFMDIYPDGASALEGKVAT
jgi:anti-sigma B factor antagonist